MRRLIEGGAYLGAALIRVNTVPSNQRASQPETQSRGNDDVPWPNTRANCDTPTEQWKVYRKTGPTSSLPDAAWGSRSDNGSSKREILGTEASVVAWSNRPEVSAMVARDSMQLQQETQYLVSYRKIGPQLARHLKSSVQISLDQWSTNRERKVKETPTWLSSLAAFQGLYT